MDVQEALWKCYIARKNYIPVKKFFGRKANAYNAQYSSYIPWYEGLWESKEKIPKDETAWMMAGGTLHPTIYDRLDNGGPKEKVDKVKAKAIQCYYSSLYLQTMDFDYYKKSQCPMYDKNDELECQKNCFTQLLQNDNIGTLTTFLERNLQAIGITNEDTKGKLQTTAKLLMKNLQKRKDDIEKQCGKTLYKKLMNLYSKIEKAVKGTLCSYLDDILKIETNNQNRKIFEALRLYAAGDGNNATQIIEKVNKAITDCNK